MVGGLQGDGVTWSAWTQPFEVPAGPLDIYHSLQRLTPGACVGGHRHDGPENGLVLSGVIARWEDGAGELTLAAGTSFVTPAALAHATGNTTSVDAEQITLHVLPRGAAFAHPCECLDFPPAAPGSTNPARMCYAVAGASERIRTRHAMVVVDDRLSLPASGEEAFLTVIEGDFAIGERRLTVGEGYHVAGRSAGTLVRGSGVVILTELRS